LDGGDGVHTGSSGGKGGGGEVDGVHHWGNGRFLYAKQSRCVVHNKHRKFADPSAAKGRLREYSESFIVIRIDLKVLVWVVSLHMVHKCKERKVYRIICCTFRKFSFVSRRMSRVKYNAGSQDIFVVSSVTFSILAAIVCCSAIVRCIVICKILKGESVESALEMCPPAGNGRFVYPNGTLMFQCCSIFVSRFIACKLLKGESVDNDLEMYHSTVLVKFVELWYCDGRLFCELQEVCVMDGTFLELFFHFSNWVIQGTLPPLKWRG